MLFYGRVFLTFLRNSLIREMLFPANFLIQVVTRLFWFAARVALFGVIYGEVDQIQEWSRHEYFAFMATGMLINSIVEAFFMPNCAAFCDNIRTGKLDFALTKPVDSQFLVSLQKVNLAMASQLLLAVSLLSWSMYHIGHPVSPGQIFMYLFYVMVAVLFFYSLMITLACTSIWFGRNQGLYDFWFYITIFAQYPRSIYDGHDSSRVETGEILQFAFSWIVPILLVVTVPAQVITGTLTDWRFAIVAVVAAGFCLSVSRSVFQWSLNHYRGASS
jgi:ABC-2 type transport system permease protein